MPDFSALSLSTEQLYLCALCETDAQALYDIYSDQLVMRYCSMSPWTAIEQAHAMISQDKEAMQAGQYLRFGIVRLVDKRLIGTCSLFALMQQCRRAELGYMLASTAWGVVICMKLYMHF